MLTRRHFIVRSLTGIATFYALRSGVLVRTGSGLATPALAAPALQTSAPWQAWHGLSTSDYQAVFDSMTAQGWRLTDVSGYEEAGEARYTAIWEQAGGPAWVGRHGLNAPAHQAAFDSLTGQGYRPVRVSGFSVNGQALFASIWHQSDGRGFQAHHGLAAGAYQAQFDALAGSGWRLTDVSGYDEGGQTTYTTVWDGLGGGFVARHGLSGDAYQASFDELGAQDYRLLRVSGYPSGGEPTYAAIWIPSDGRAWSGIHGVPGDQYQGVFDNLVGQGFRPVQVSGFSAGGQTRFAGIYDQRQFGGGATLAIDDVVNTFMVNQGIPGLQLAISKDGRLVYSASYGYADVQFLETVRPDSRFRIASLAKALTSAAIFLLEEAGSLNLSDTVFGNSGLLGNQYGTLPYGTGVTSITIQNLLEHTEGTGWSNAVGSDPMFLQPSLSQQDLITWVLDNRPLVTTPGSTYQYSNFGYCVLGRVIEELSGQSYADYVQQNVLAPCGVFGMEIAGNTVGDRKAGEVLYYGGNPYNMNVTRMDAHGGWIATAADLLRFVAGVDGFATRPDILSADSITTMTTGSAANPGYAKGWGVGGGTWNHLGGLDGTATAMQRQGDGINWVVLANASNNSASRLEGLLPGLMNNVLATVTIWPDIDMF